MSAGTPLAHAAALVEDRLGLRRVLHGWQARGWLRALDVAFADFLAEQVGDAPAQLILAAALASHQLGRGHAALDLGAVLADPARALSLPPDGEVGGVGGTGGTAAEAEIPAPAELLAGLSLERWLAALDHPALVAAGSGDTPLVRVGTRLYLRRYWQYEQDLRAALEQRLQPGAALPAERLRAILAALFVRGESGGSDESDESGESGDPGAGGNDWQQLACALAARSAFSVITGGPGTGKTTTVVRLLALLQALALAAPQPPAAAAGGLRIRLAAPTGKAAARLNASIAGAVASLPLAALADGEAIRASIPRRVQTLHRLLGSRPDSRRFRHHAGNPLALDVLVVDEASMIDLELMTALLAALPASARLILLGDKDQLASVEAGAVLGELCARAEAGHYTRATADWLAAACGERVDAALIDAAGRPLDQAVAMLRRSYRFDAGSGIGHLAQAVNAGDRAALAQLRRTPCADLGWLALGARRSAGALPDAFAALVVDGGAADCAPAPARRGYRHYLETLRREQPAADAPGAAFDAWARAVLAAHAGFQLLCALRRGPYGVTELNRRVERALHAAGLIAAGEGGAGGAAGTGGEWYLGRPVLVTRNDYALGLMNGDIGITLARPAPDGSGLKLRVAFAAGDEDESGAPAIRWVLPSRLQSVETVYALTVHKSQGSEFAHAALLVPDSPSPILTRELIYTAITRARSFLTLACAGHFAVVEQAIGQRVLRSGGLFADV